jgi:hypothetical protein
MAGKKKGAKKKKEKKEDPKNPKNPTAAAAGQGRAGAVASSLAALPRDDGGAARKTAFASLMAVVEAKPSHEVHLAEVRQTKRLDELAVPQLEKLEWCARMGKPDEADRYRVASALARAGALGVFFDHSTWISKEYASNPYICTPPPGDQSSYAKRFNPSGISYTAINHLLEILHLGGRLSFVQIMQIGGPLLQALVSQAASPATRHTHLVGGSRRRIHLTSAAHLT